MAHVPAQLCDSSQSERRGHKGRAGIVAPCEQPHHVGHLYASRYASEAPSAKQGSQDDFAEERFRSRGGRMKGAIVPFCSHAVLANFSYVIEKNGGDDGTR